MLICLLSLDKIGEWW